MSSESIFFKLDDKEKFISRLSTDLREMPDFISCSWKGIVTVDQKKIEASFDTYQENLGYFSRHLLSRSPDQFKRAAALLMALCYHGGIIASIQKNNVVDYKYENGESSLPYIQLVDLYFNELIIFNVCYRYCATYCNPSSYKRLSAEDYENICTVIKKHIHSDVNVVLSLDSAFIIFRSLFCN